MSWNHRLIKKKNIITLVAPVAFLLACSTYTLPSESKTIVKKENLKAYNPKNFATQTEQEKKAKLKNEDQLIMKAIFLEDAHAYEQSHELYALLYQKTGKEEYLLKELNTAYLAGLLSPNLEQLKSYIQNNPKNFQAQRLLLSFDLKAKKFDEAKEVAQKLTSNSTHAIDFELAANPYIFSGEYQTALNYLTEAYKKTLNEEILFKIITIKINYLKDVEGAIEDLENHKEKQGCSEKICLQLAAIYSEQKKNDKLVATYKALYQSTKKEIYFEKTIESYLVNKEVKSAIDYLKEIKSHEAILYSLYMEAKNYQEANLLAKQLIQKTNDPRWYAESAISLYESLGEQADKNSLSKVVDDFENAFSHGEKNPVYLNYYGYTLIDKKIDIEKGIKLIQQALELEPANSYFLDSLAWGYYQQNNCEQAYPTMKKVVEVEGLKDKEIISHWNAINNKCKKVK